MVYVDDFLTTSSGGIKDLKRRLHNNFKIEYLGPLTYFFGLEIHLSSTSYMVDLSTPRIQLNLLI